MSTLDRPRTMPTQRDEAGLEVLSEDECMELLRQVPVGRIGLTLNALPAVLPVNFAVLDGDIVIRTGGGTKLQAAMSNAVVAFEADGYDDEDQTGWSVMLTGVAKEITDPSELERARRLSLRPWAPSPRDRYIRIASHLISGRRIPRPAHLA